VDIKEKLLKLDGVEGVGKAGQSFIVFISKDSEDLRNQIRQIVGEMPIIIKLTSKFKTKE
jgi:phosphotransferase system IIB component